MKHARLTHLSVEDYLEGERDAETRHEYAAGQAFAMTGARDVHNIVAGNIYSNLRGKLRGGPCRVFISDMKLRVEAADAFYYPDVLVTCDARDTEPYFKCHPVLVIEVLSPSTEVIDRREKLHNYRKLETLREYAMVSTDARQVEICRRGVTGEWIIFTYTEGDAVEFESLGHAMSLDEIYEDAAPAGLEA
jgi:Uma2 family endonuclease